MSIKIHYKPMCWCCEYEKWIREIIYEEYIKQGGHGGAWMAKPVSIVLNRFTTSQPADVWSSLCNDGDAYPLYEWYIAHQKNNNKNFLIAMV